MKDIIYVFNKSSKSHFFIFFNDNIILITKSHIYFFIREEK